MFFVLVKVRVSVSVSEVVAGIIGVGGFCFGRAKGMSY
jgi:hypothetical protein